MKTINIKHRYTDEIIYTTEVDDTVLTPLGTALQRAVLERVCLAGANLSGAQLIETDLLRADFTSDFSHAAFTHADFTGADFTGDDLSGSDLWMANLSGADLKNVNLTNTNLVYVNFTGADLTNANLLDGELKNADLTNANLTNANFTGANLMGANLTNTNLMHANLTRIRDDVYRVLNLAPDEVPGLLSAIRGGRVDGNCYSGECACLVGTIANIRGVLYYQLNMLKPNSYSPAERWFLGISKGDTPANNLISEITEKWICEWVSPR
jgi:uncharacterized protein YjbI with pentapeptide repeats